MTVDHRSAVRDSLRGLALGDCFGETWFAVSHGWIEERLARREVSAGRWSWTDDTAMALVLVDVLRQHGEVRQDALAAAFAAAYAADPDRGYGPSMHGVLRGIFMGDDWSVLVGRQFGGQGSWGNGAAMRVAPLGAWFAADLDRVVEQARRSAEVTHAHPEAAAGAVAVAVAAALAVNRVPADQLLDRVRELTPASEVADRLLTVAGRTFADEPLWVAGEVGSGLLISAPDTVPFALWCAARHLDDLTEALWATAAGGGDNDTTCAIVGGVVAGRTGLDGVPPQWLASAEPLPGWVDDLPSG